MSLERTKFFLVKKSMQKTGAICKAIHLLVLVLLSSIAAGPIFAAESGLAIEEVIVTALRREASLQNTPVSITAFSAGDIESRSIAVLSEIGNYTPNLSFGSTGVGSGDSARVHMRGIGQTDFIITTDPGVGMYVDGAYLSRSFGSLFGLLDIERIEVLRGPQGTLYGKNTIGGAINVVSVKPHEEFEGYAKVTTGSFDRLDGKVAVNLPLVKDRLFARLSAMSTNNNGYATNIFDGSDMSDDDTIAARGAFRFLATENLELELTIDGARKRAASENSKLVAVDPTAALFFPINLFIGPFNSSLILADPYTTNGEFSGHANVNNLDVFGTTFAATWNINENLTLKSITAYREMETLFGADQDGTTLAIAHTLDDVEQEQISQELQFSGIGFDNRLNWIAGVYFINEQAKEFNDVDLVPGFFPIIGVDVSIDVINETDNSSYAIYGHSTYDLTEQLSLSAGIRYTYEEKEYFAHHVNPNSMFTIINETVDENWDSFSPKFGIEYRWNRDLMTYASISHGFKSGGFNGRPLPNSPGLESFDPENVWSYEIGFKSQFLNDRVRLNMSAFYNDYTDIQVTLLGLTDDNGNLLISVRNAAEAEILGFESELTWRVSEGLDLSAGLGFTDASYNKFQDGTIDRSGADFAYTPKWTFTVAGNYEAPLGDLGTLRIHADYSFRSSQFLDTVNSAALNQESYGLVNLRLAYETPDQQFSLAVFGKNLTDEVYMTNGIDASSSFGFTFASFAQPRTWGLEGQYRF